MGKMLSSLCFPVNGVETIKGKPHVDEEEEEEDGQIQPEDEEEKHEDPGQPEDSFYLITPCEGIVSFG